jgi:two-component system copper resistance phosphate regulon response regulator CusR
MRILLVEDELKTGDYLKQGLSEAGYMTDWVTDGISGKHHAMSEDYDLIILDVMLPEINGWSILEAIRRSGKLMPVLFLSARDQVEDRVKGFELGADDYLVKPFAFAELLARIKNLLRRGQQRDDDVICVADLELDLRKRRVTRAGQRIDLTAKEFALMELFMRRRGEVLPRSLIASQVWDMNFDSDTNVVEVAIKRLRSKIDNNFSPRLIQNIRGMGYVLEIEDGAGI